MICGTATVTLVAESTMAIMATSAVPLAHQR